MEIIINKCYGGFGVSPEAVLELIKRKSEIIETSESGECESFYRWEEFTDGYEQSGMMGSLKKDGVIYSTKDRNEIRTDPTLIAVIRDLGDTASGFCADLSIVEIPDGVEWEIEEYDGIEWIAEAHQTWG